MSEPVRFLHYVNQFFGGLGGEEEANRPVEARDGPVGPARALAQVLKDRGTVVGTLIGGDNYVAENQEASVAALEDAIERFKPDALVAGPAFDAGRYGLAAAVMCRAAGERGLPAVAAMHPDNTGVITLGKDLIVVPTGVEIGDMPAILSKAADLALKMAAGEELGPALEEGYVPRGLRRHVERERNGAERAIDMLTARVTGQPYESEVYRRAFDHVEPPAPIEDMSSTTVALVSTGGLVPKGNPDRIESGRTTEFAVKYSVEGLKEFTIEDWEAVHTGYYSGVVNSRDTNYILPLRSIRQLEAEGVIGGVYPSFFSTAGNGMAVRSAKKIGEGIAEELSEADVGAVVLVAT